MYKFFSNIRFKKQGFTLVELLVVVGMLSILLAIAVFLLNPITQINKARDAQKKHDFEQIRNALDTYYNDYGCYPSSIPFGYEWSEGDTVYMKKVPQDEFPPTCTNGSCYYYYYQTDGSSCSQWAILYAKLQISPSTEEICANKIIRKMCPASEYRISTNLRYNYCLPIGDINCTGLKNAAMPNPYTVTSTPIPTPIPTVTPVPTPSPVPTPTPTYPPGTCTCETAFTDLRPACNNVGLSNGGLYCDLNCSVIAVNCTGTPCLCPGSPPR